MTILRDLSSASLYSAHLIFRELIFSTIIHISRNCHDDENGLDSFEEYLARVMAAGPSFKVVEVAREPRRAESTAEARREPSRTETRRDESRAETRRSRAEPRQGETRAEQRRDEAEQSSAEARAEQRRDEAKARKRKPAEFRALSVKESASRNCRECAFLYRNAQLRAPPSPRARCKRRSSSASNAADWSGRRARSRNARARTTSRIIAAQSKKGARAERATQQRSPTIISLCHNQY